MVTELIAKYIWLLRAVMDTGEAGITLGEISGRYERRFGETLARRTFANYRIGVEETFGVGIACDRSTNRYMIDSSSRMSDSGAAEWLIDSFTVNSLLERGKEALSGRIEVEPVPSGHRFLTRIMEAMLEGRRIAIEYCKYSSAAPERLTVLPYALKEDKRRWYLYGHCIERGALRCYALDRLVSLEILPDRFIYPENFSLGELLATSFGTYIPREGEKGSTVEFRARGVQAKYISDLPIHHSQKFLKTEGEWTYFSIFVSPDSDDLYFELRKYGSAIEVLSPERVRRRLRDEALAVIGIYGETENPGSKA